MKALVIAVALALSACTTTVSTPRQGVAACYSGVTATANTAADLDARGKLTAEQKERVKKAASEALFACDTAKAAIASGDLSKADGQLKAAETILLTIEATLGAQK